MAFYLAIVFTVCFYLCLSLWLFFISSSPPDSAACRGALCSRLSVFHFCLYAYLLRLSLSLHVSLVSLRIYSRSCRLPGYGSALFSLVEASSLTSCYSSCYWQTPKPVLLPLVHATLPLQRLLVLLQPILMQQQRHLLLPLPPERPQRQTLLLQGQLVLELQQLLLQGPLLVQ